MTDTGYAVQDAALSETKALSNGAGAVNSAGFDLGALTYLGSRLAAMQGKITLPVLTTVQLPNGETMTAKVQHADASDFSDATTLYDAVAVQTGAGGAGAAAKTAKYVIPPQAKRYVRVVATKTGTGDCTAKSLTHALVF
jgi:hypothetical protein